MLVFFNKSFKSKFKELINICLQLKKGFPVKLNVNGLLTNAVVDYDDIWPVKKSEVC